MNYVLRSSEQFNMVLLIPDSIFDGGAATVERNVDEIREIHRVRPKMFFLTIHFRPHHANHLEGMRDLFTLCELVCKCNSPPAKNSLNSFTLAHATPPYVNRLMSLEEATVVGECPSQISSRSGIWLALPIQETCREKRVTKVVQRGEYSAKPSSPPGLPGAAGERHGGEDCATRGGPRNLGLGSRVRRAGGCRDQLAKCNREERIGVRKGDKGQLSVSL